MIRAFPWFYNRFMDGRSVRFHAPEPFGAFSGINQIRFDVLPDIFGSLKKLLFLRLFLPGIDKAYDRLGLTDESESILGVKLPLVTIPVRPGRNLAVILELAAMNNRQKKMGYNAAAALAAEHDRAIDAGTL